MNKPTRKEWEESGFSVPDELCSAQTETAPGAPDSYSPAAIGAAWLKDSRLEKWFPFTAKELATLKAERDELREALAGMLENYIELKNISLISARSDAPNWIGASLSPNDDIHVVKARAVLAKGKPDKPQENP